MAKVFRGMFLMILGWKCCLNAVVECVKTIVKTMVFNDFTFSTYSLISCPVEGIWLTFLCLLVTLGSLFLTFEGIGIRVEF